MKYHYRTVFQVLMVAFACLLVACQSVPGLQDQRETAPLHHVVLLWLNTDDKQVIDEIIEHTYDLAAIEEVREVYANRSVDTGRAIADSSFQVGIVVTVDDVAALQTYLKNPIHTNFVKRYVKAHLKKIVVYDF